MTQITLFRTSQFRTAASHLNSVVEKKNYSTRENFRPSVCLARHLDATFGPLIFAALLILCSLGVGCSSEQPKVASNQPASLPLAVTSSAPVAAPPAEDPSVKPGRRRVVRKAPPTLTFTDKISGVSFQYPPQDSLKTAAPAANLVSSSANPMDFIAPGGVAIVAVAIPKTAYRATDLDSAFFNVSLHQGLNADQCSEFSISQLSPAVPSEQPVQAVAQVTAPPVSNSKQKLMIGDLELRSTQATLDGTTSTGSRQETVKYFHVFQNNACYEFALRVATRSSDLSVSAKHVEPSEVFPQLEKILATVRINADAPKGNLQVKSASEATAEERSVQ